MAEPAGSGIVDVESSRAAPISRPAKVTGLILDADRSVSPFTASL
ncbi:hypothetical protein [Streptomyces scopuliridis]